METVVTEIRRGGVDTVYVWCGVVNCPIKQPNVNFLISLYLNQSIIPATITEAAAAGIFGVKSYPGVALQRTLALT